MNFKNYSTGPLIITIAVLIVISNLIIDLLEPFITSIIPHKYLKEIEIIADYIGIFSVIGIVTSVFYLIDTWGWKLAIFKWMIDIPNLNGRYIGKLTSDYGNGITKDAILEIYQTASKITISGYFADENSTIQTSRSYSKVESISKELNGQFSLIHLYANSPHLTSQQIYDHGGTVVLSYHEDLKTLKGEYYNKRKNHGSLDFKFEAKKILGRFK